MDVFVRQAVGHTLNVWRFFFKCRKDKASRLSNSKERSHITLGYEIGCQNFEIHLAGSLEPPSGNLLLRPALSLGTKIWTKEGTNPPFENIPLQGVTWHSLSCTEQQDVTI